VSEGNMFHLTDRMFIDLGSGHAIWSHHEKNTGGYDSGPSGHILGSSPISRLEKLKQVSQTGMPVGQEN